VPCEHCGSEDFFDDGTCRACPKDTEKIHCPNCGHDKANVKGDCAECDHPEIAPPTPDDEPASEPEPDDGEPNDPEASVETVAAVAKSGMDVVTVTNFDPALDLFKHKLASRQRYLTESTLARIQAEHDLDTAKSELKDAIALENSAATQFQELVSNGPSHTPLFDKHEEPTAEPQSDVATAAGAETEPTATPEPAAGDDDFWFAKTLEEIDVPKGIVKLCTNNPEMPIHTVGDVQKWTRQQKDIGDPLQKIKGMGKKKADQLEDCLTALWKQRAEA
jgi:hypothetical protein